jgi:hypothetical protein
VFRRLFRVQFVQIPGNTSSMARKEPSFWKNPTLPNSRPSVS